MKEKEIPETARMPTSFNKKKALAITQPM